MTPKAPSGTPTPRRSFKAEFKAWLASKAGKPVRPFPGQSPTPLVPVAPAISQEQFTDAQRPITQQQEIRTRQLMDRICALNNANVTRDYGTHTEDLTKHHQPAPLTADDMADFDRLLTTARPLDPPGARKSMFAEPRRQVRQSHNYAVESPSPLFVPDLPSAAAVQAQIASVTGYEPPAPAPSYDSGGGGGDFGGGGASSSWD